MSNTTNVAIGIDHLTKRYDAQHGIYDVSLKVNKGEIFGFLGPNGAGKSTTINTILDILRPNEGTITILGLDHQKDVKAVHACIGYLASDMETDPLLTGKQYLRFVASIHKNIDKKRVDHLVERLKADVHTKIKHLSRGNKQKIGLIAALMHSPEVLILDEPTSGLDPLVQSEFYTILHEHQKEGKTTFMSSHVLSEVQTICDRVGFIRDGKLIQVSELTSLLEKASRQVVVNFQKPAGISAIKKLAGTRQFQETGTRLSFTFDGNLNQLLEVLANNPVSHVEISDANLEELFMEYYKKGDHNV
jgi:ABC-2 type transport system ATP-binding protein